MADPMELALVVAVALLLLVQLVALAGRPRRPGVRLPWWAPLAVGAGLRLAWVCWATRAPTGFTDPAEYLRIASDFGHGILPRFGGLDHSAYWPPGYPAILAPFVAVADRTGWISPAFTASLVNVVAGTATIALSGALAARWLGERARSTAAWLVALCPALVYWTSTAHAETVFTAVLLAALVLAGRSEAWTRRQWVAFGLLVGLAFLIRTPGAIAALAPALALRSTGASWRAVGRATGAVAIGALVLLVPWTIRNGVQVGIWTPSSTNNASVACFGHHDEAEPRWAPFDQSPEYARDCFGYSPFDDPRLLATYESQDLLPEGAEVREPDEPRYYREAMGRAVRWAATHPVDEVPLSLGKVWETWHGEGRVVDGARNYQTDWSGDWEPRLTMAADLWLWVVGPAAIAALALRRRCRRATMVWAPIALYTAAILVGVAEPHYRYPVVPLVAVLAAGLPLRDDVSDPAPIAAPARPRAG